MLKAFAFATIVALAAPAAAARLWSDRLAVVNALAVLLAVGSGLAGLAISSRWNVAAGASISLTATALLGLSFAARSVCRPSRPAVRAAG